MVSQYLNDKGIKKKDELTLTYHYFNGTSPCCTLGTPILLALGFNAENFCLKLISNSQIHWKEVLPLCCAVEDYLSVSSTASWANNQTEVYVPGQGFLVLIAIAHTACSCSEINFCNYSLVNFPKHSTNSHRFAVLFQFSCAALSICYLNYLIY